MLVPSYLVEKDRWITRHKSHGGYLSNQKHITVQTHGIPESVCSDNGPPFSSAEFEGFLDYLEIIIIHLKGSPFWPQINGEVERCNETFLTIIRIAT